MLEHDRKELVRLQVASLRQGGLILKQLGQVQRDAAKHAVEDARLFGAQRAEHEKLKTEVGWMKRIGSFLITALGLGHFVR